MKQYKVTIKIRRIGVGDEYKTNIVSAETWRKANEKIFNKIMEPLRIAAEGKNVVYEIIGMHLIERGKSNADDN